jgi:hypothetical protein
MQEDLSLTQRANPDKSLTTFDAASKKTAIRLGLARLAIRRQANPGKETMDLYAADLMPMETTDVLSALESLSCRRRAEGETSFPDWATVTDEVNACAIRRRIAERKAKEALELAEYERIVRERPEEFVHVRDVWKEVSDRLIRKVGAA